MGFAVVHHAWVVTQVQSKETKPGFKLSICLNCHDFTVYEGETGWELLVEHWADKHVDLMMIQHGHTIDADPVDPPRKLNLLIRRRYDILPELCQAYGGVLASSWFDHRNYHQSLAPMQLLAVSYHTKVRFRASISER